jgi:hypothetical protein
MPDEPRDGHAQVGHHAFEGTRDRELGGKGRARPIWRRLGCERKGFPDFETDDARFGGRSHQAAQQRADFEHRARIECAGADAGVVQTSCSTRSGVSTASCRTATCSVRVRRRPPFAVAAGHGLEGFPEENLTKIDRLFIEAQQHARKGKFVRGPRDLVRAGRLRPSLRLFRSPNSPD